MCIVISRVLLREHLFVSLLWSIYVYFNLYFCICVFYVVLVPTEFVMPTVKCSSKSTYCCLLLRTRHWRIPYSCLSPLTPLRFHLGQCKFMMRGTSFPRFPLPPLNSKWCVDTVWTVHRPGTSAHLTHLTLGSRSPFGPANLALFYDSGPWMVLSPSQKTMSVEVSPDIVNKDLTSVRNLTVYWPCTRTI